MVDVYSLQWFRTRGGSKRKLRLFSCACCRLVWKRLEDNRSHAAIETSELYADLLVKKKEVVTSRARALEIVENSGTTPAAYAAAAVARDRIVPEWIAGLVLAATRSKKKLVDQGNLLLRDIFGSNSAPTKIDPAWSVWNNGTVIRLAEAIYEERDLPSGHLDAGRLAILADALEDAGCANADMLAHCRGPGPHVRGCWVVDLLIGKE